MLTFKDLEEDDEYSEEMILRVQELVIEGLIKEGKLPLSKIAQMAFVSEDLVWKMAQNIENSKRFKD